MKNNKGITLTSLVIYIALVFVITAVVMRITTHFKGNMADAADVSFETEFNKLNLYLLEESKQKGNKIQEITDGLHVKFTNGNVYTYNVTEKIVYLNEGIKICENIEDCLFEQKIAENGKDVLSLKITIGETTKNAEYVMRTIGAQDGGVDIDDYLVGASKVTYYLKAGDYVDYTPTTGTYKVADGETGSGYTTTAGYQEFTTEEDNETTTDVDESLKWRVWSIDEQTGEIELISATAAQSTTPLYLQGADGYNHGVDILNDLCETLYSKKVDGKTVAIARSINAEDIIAKTTYDYTKYDNGIFKYGDKKQLSTYGAEYMNYPKLYAQEIGFGVAGAFNIIGLRESEGLYDGATDVSGVTKYSTVTGFANGNIEGTDPYVTSTYYYIKVENFLANLGINTMQKGVIDIGTIYYLASRDIATRIDRTDFEIRIIDSSGGITDATLISSRGWYGNTSSAVRPVVTLDATELLDFSVGDGSEANPWGMK